MVVQRAGGFMDPPVKPEGDRWGPDTTPAPPASASFAGLTGESMVVQRAGGTMDPPVKPEGDDLVRPQQKTKSGGPKAAARSFLVCSARAGQNRSVPLTKKRRPSTS